MIRVFVPNVKEQFAWACVWTFHPSIRNRLNRDLMCRIAFLLGESHSILDHSYSRDDYVLAAAVALEYRLITFHWDKWESNNLLIDIIFAYASQPQRRILLYTQRLWSKYVVFHSQLKFALQCFNPKEDESDILLLSNNTVIEYDPNPQHEPQGIVDWAIFCNADHTHDTIEWCKNLKHVTIFHGNRCQKNFDWKRLGFEIYDADLYKNKNWIFY